MQKKSPSTKWKERIASDEAQRFAEYGQQFAALQARKSHKYGVGRALHRKQITAAQGELEVLGGLPAFAAQGLFAKAGRYPVWVRLSNGGMDRRSDKVPDVRGFALRVLQVQGDSALGIGPAVSQDFALINHAQFAFPRSDEFVDFVLAAAQGGSALLRYLVRRYGVVGAVARTLQMARTVGQSFGGFAATPMYSAAPIACGPYAVRVRLLPLPANGPPAKRGQSDYGREFSARLQQQDLVWELQLQPFVDEKTTPIEDASVNWSTPYTTVARLTLPRQNPQADTAFARKVEASVFDPWQALVEHRPLGDVMRARKVVYFESQKGRGAV